MNIPNVFGPDLVEKIVRDFGIEGEAEEAKKYLLGQLMENISNRVLFEAKKLVPTEKLTEFTELVEGSDADAIERFLAPYISNFQSFALSEAQKEIEQTKSYMLEESEAAVTGGGQ